MFTRGINKSASVTLEGAERVAAWLDKQDSATKSAHQAAVKVEGFRLMNLLKSEIKKGAPGGNTFGALTFIARRMQKKVRGSGSWKRQSPNRKPLANMATGVRYAVTQTPFSMAVGFVQPAGRSNQISSTWQRLAKIHQTGFYRDVTQKQREAFARRGGELGTVEGGSTPFFLKKTTTKMSTPGRQIIAPFWQAHKSTAKSNIRENFRRKMAGERI